MLALLQIDSSPRAASVSSRLAAAFVEKWKRQNPGGTVFRHNTSLECFPYLDENAIDASFTPAAERTAAQKSALAFSDQLVDELLAADVVVLGAPMWNLSIPASLKAWIDHVVRPGRTFRVTSTGKVGLLIDRPILAIVACGGRFDDGGPGLPQVDHLGPYLRTVFATVGLTDFELLRLEQLRRGSGAVERGLAAAGAWIEAQRARFARG